MRRLFTTTSCPVPLVKLGFLFNATGTRKKVSIDPNKFRVNMKNMFRQASLYATHLQTFRTRRSVMHIITFIFMPGEITICLFSSNLLAIFSYFCIQKSFSIIKLSFEIYHKVQGGPLRYFSKQCIVR